MSGDVILKDAILSGLPCVLLLGQATDGDRTSASVLSRLLERKGLRASVGWPEVLANGLTSEDLEWLTERFERTVPTEAFKSALELPWAAVFTSSIDPSLLRHLATLGRQGDNTRLQKDRNRFCGDRAGRAQLRGDCGKRTRV